jgi:hypothetical protein
MRFTCLLPALAPALLLAATATPASAVNVAWGDWWNAEGLYGAFIDAPGGQVTAIYAGAANGLVSGPCIGAVGDLWATGDYAGPVNKPVCDRVLLSVGGAKSIMFSEAVDNPYLALMNWGEVSVEFDAPFELVSIGTGYFGTGIAMVNEGSTGFQGQGPVHAILRFNGSFTSIGFTDTGTQSLRFLTVGVGDGATAVPEPASWAMLIAGFGLVGWTLRRRAVRTPAVTLA